MWGLLVGAALVVYLLSRQDMIVVHASRIAGQEGPLRLSQEQQAMADIITAEFAQAGLRWLADAAIANAYAESLLDTMAIGDGGRSVGLFQLHDRGVGYGMTVASRQDPVTNTKAIIAEAERRGVRAFQKKRQAFLVVWFARAVERCKACGHAGGDSELYRRAAIYARMFGVPALMEVQK